MGHVPRPHMWLLAPAALAPGWLRVTVHLNSLQFSGAAAALRDRDRPWAWAVQM